MVFSENVIGFAQYLVVVGADLCVRVAVALTLHASNHVVFAVLVVGYAVPKVVLGAGSSILDHRC